MKYKIGDKVRIVNKWRSGEQNPAGKMDKWLGKVMTICDTTTCRFGKCYRMEEDKGEHLGVGWFWHGDDIAGLATEYKVGDYVIIEESNIEETSSYAGLVGTIKAVTNATSEHTYLVSTDKCPLGVWCKVKCLVNQKIIVTTDGKTTTAKLFNGKELVKSAEAKCSPADTFNFETGAAIAINRLLDREEKGPVNPYKIGDYVRVTGQTKYGHILPIGSAGRVTKVDENSCYVDGFSERGARIEQWLNICDLAKI